LDTAAILVDITNGAVEKIFSLKNKWEVPVKRITNILVLTWIGLFGMLSAHAISPGSKVENFSLTDSRGQQHSLTDYQKKKAILLIFISTKCPVSNAYNQRLAKLYADYAAKGVAILGINANRNETAEMINAHAKKHGFKFPILLDKKNIIADELGAKVTPEAFLLSNQLTLLYHGHIDDSQREAQVKKTGLRDALNEALAGKQVTDKLSKPFGCSIKRVRK